jgi:hypothetical protein
MMRLYLFIYMTYCLFGFNYQDLYNFDFQLFNFIPFQQVNYYVNYYSKLIDQKGLLVLQQFD